MPPIPYGLNNAKYGRRVHGLSDDALAEVDAWPTPDEGALEDKALKEYQLRKQAIKSYLGGESKTYIKKTFGYSLSHVYRLLRERCLAIHPDGQFYGWRGLVPFLRIKPYRRKTKIRVGKHGEGAVGAMQAVLDNHPDLRKAFDKRILKSTKADELGPAKKPRLSHWNWFLDQLRGYGYETKMEWPFNTRNNGYVTVCRYIDSVLSDNPKKAARVLGGPDSERKLISGDGTDRPIKEVFERVEMDAHKLDGRFCVLLPSPAGGYVARIIHRIWVLVILEVVSRAILGYHMSFNREVSKEDVLRTIKKALTKWHPRKLFFSDNAYHEQAGFPSSLSKHFLGVCWNETLIDGALALKAHVVRDFLKNVAGANLIDPSQGFQRRRSKDDRPFIESFFRTIASGGFQKMTNTTGGKPNGSQGRDPAAIALNSEFQIEYAEELLDVMIANYNARPHNSLGGRSPLQYLQYVSSRSDLPLRYADPNSVQSILSFREKCRVRGGYEEGRRPYIHFGGGRYTGDILSQRYDLVGQYIWAINHLEDDARVVEASTLNGMRLGVLRASPPWHKFPHSLAVRRSINSCIRSGLFKVPAGADAVEVFLDFFESQKEKKLPVHPAYLEARRILTNQAELRIGKPILEAALERVEQDEKAQRDAKKTSKKKVDAETFESNLEKKSVLPARRKAASD